MNNVVLVGVFRFSNYIIIMNVKVERSLIYVIMIYDNLLLMILVPLKIN